MTICIKNMLKILLNLYITFYILIYAYIILNRVKNVSGTYNTFLWQYYIIHSCMKLIFINKIYSCNEFHAVKNKLKYKYSI